MRLAVANDFYKDWLEENYFPIIRKAVMVVSGKEMEISLEVDSSCFQPAKEDGSSAETQPGITLQNLGFPKARPKRLARWG